jgi:hypothetical protein
MDGRCSGFAAAVNELRKLLLRPKTPRETVERALYVAKSVKHSLVFVPQAPGTPMAVDGATLFQGTDFFLEFVAAVRARDWEKVGILHDQIAPSEIEITAEMIEAGARILADRFEQKLDWHMRDIAREIYRAMLSGRGGAPAGPMPDGELTL